METLKTFYLLESMVELQRDFDESNTKGWEIVHISIILDKAIILIVNKLTNQVRSSIYTYDSEYNVWISDY